MFIDSRKPVAAHRWLAVSTILWCAILLPRPLRAQDGEAWEKFKDRICEEGPQSPGFYLAPAKEWEALRDEGDLDRGLYELIEDYLQHRKRAPPHDQHTLLGCYGTAVAFATLAHGRDKRLLPEAISFFQRSLSDPPQPGQVDESASAYYPRCEEWCAYGLGGDFPELREPIRKVLWTSPRGDVVNVILSLINRSEVYHPSVEFYDWWIDTLRGVRNRPECQAVPSLVEYREHGGRNLRREDSGFYWQCVSWGLDRGLGDGSGIPVWEWLRIEYLKKNGLVEPKQHSSTDSVHGGGATPRASGGASPVPGGAPKDGGMPDGNLPLKRNIRSGDDTSSPNGSLGRSDGAWAIAVAVPILLALIWSVVRHRRR